MSLTAKNIAINGGYYLATLALVPGALLVLEARLGVVHRPSLTLRSVAVATGLIGATLQAWSIVLFQRVGRGTPSPALPPAVLVIAGPYRWMRNPMNVGEVLLLLALAAWIASPLLLAYAAGAWLAFHAFVVRWEEPRLQGRFGEEYARYRRAVGRWLPRRRRAPSAPAATRPP